MKQPSDIEKTCESLHKINKHAKKYAELADENYRRGKKATARLNSIKKKALYSLKTKVLKRLYDFEYHDRIELHDINGREYYCFNIEQWSFHAPVDDWSGSHPAKREISCSKSIENFSKGTESHTDMSLKAALLYLNNEFGFNPNEYLEEENVSYGHRSYFAGWDYLN
ncbi:hypothetical protein [Halosimplex halobium]|uniref:hypothetical protein n=1 Tax=Halosimplex halobium TaxID=3396618 RepID=UPI003F559C23